MMGHSRVGCVVTPASKPGWNEESMEYRPMARNLPTDPFLRGYLECAEWCGLQEEDREALELSVSPRWSEASLVIAKLDCATFVAEWGHLIEDDLARAGHDFFLTRNHHGAGFWDGRWPPLAGKALTDASHAHGETSVTFDAEKEELGGLE